MFSNIAKDERLLFWQNKNNDLDSSLPIEEAVLLK